MKRRIMTIAAVKIDLIGLNFGNFAQILNIFHPFNQVRNLFRSHVNVIFHKFLHLLIILKTINRIMITDLL